MKLHGATALVTGAASGLGAASAQALAERGSTVVLCDLDVEAAEAVRQTLSGRGHVVAACDVSDATQIAAALDEADKLGSLRSLVHCAGRGGSVRVVERSGDAGSVSDFSDIVTVNLVGTFNVLRLAAARMARTEAIDGERGVCVLTASVAAFEGQVGQTAYAASKAGVVGMTLVAARDLARHLVRVVSIAPGLFDTPMLARVPEPARSHLAASSPHPARLGYPREFARLAADVIENPMLNGETIRLDGALRMGAR